MTTRSTTSDDTGFADEDPLRVMDHDADILDALNRPAARGWRPAPGDTLSGRVVDTYSSGEGEYGEYPIVEVVTSEGDIVALHCFHTTLRSAVDRRKPKVGDRIGVRYDGRLTSGGFGDKGYESYKMVLIPAPVA